VVVEVRLVDALEVFGVDRLGDVEADDFGDALTPELREQEERLRAQIPSDYQGLSQ
jgi:hypothetical protein